MKKKTDLKAGERADLTFAHEVKNVDSERYTLTMVASTQTKDSHGDIMMMDGIDLKRYKKNPVILNSHKQTDITDVIGRATKTWIEGKGKKAKLMQEWEFAVDANPKAEIAFKLFEGGFAKASSIGFIPKDLEFDEKENAFKITEWELLEVSAVAVPANSLAVMSKSIGVDEEEIVATGLVEKFSEGKPVDNEEEKDEDETPEQTPDEETEEVVEETKTEEDEPEEVEVDAEEQMPEVPKEDEKRFSDVSKTPKRKSYKAKAIMALNRIDAEEKRQLRIAHKAIGKALGVDSSTLDRKTQKQVRRRAMHKAARILMDNK